MSHLARRFLFLPLTRLLISLLVGLAVGAVGVRLLSPAPGMVLGIDVAMAVFVIAGLLVLWPMDAEQTRRTARSEYLRPVVDEIVVVGAITACLSGLVALQMTARQDAGVLPVLLALAGVFLTWSALHVMYAVRYAWLYYDQKTPGGIDFNTDAPPCYQDFFYLAFAVGMTYGVTDPSVRTTQVRAVALRQSLLSFVFGTVIVATVINVIAGSIGG